MIEKLHNISTAATTTQTLTYPDIAEISMLLEKDFVIFAALGYCSPELIIERIAIACHPDCNKAKMLYNSLTHANYDLFSANATSAIKTVKSQIKNIRLEQIMHSIKLNKSNTEIALKILLSFKYSADDENYKTAVESILWQFRDDGNHMQNFAADIMELMEYDNGALEVPSGEYGKWSHLYTQLEIISENPPLPYMTKSEKKSKEREFQKQENLMVKDLSELVKKSLFMNGQLPLFMNERIDKSKFLDKSLYKIDKLNLDYTKEKIEIIVNCFLRVQFTEMQEVLRILITNGIIKYISAENNEEIKTAIFQTAKQLIELNFYSIPTNIVFQISKIDLEFKLDEQILTIFSKINKAITVIFNSSELESANLIKSQQIYYRDFLNSVEKYFTELVENNFMHYSEVFKTDLKSNLLYCLNSLVDFSKIHISCAYLRATTEPLSAGESSISVLFSPEDLECIKSYVLTKEDIKKIIIRQEQIKKSLKEENIDVTDLQFNRLLS